MKNIILRILLVLSSVNTAQVAFATDGIRFQVKFSKPLAVFVFVQNLNSSGRPNFPVYRTKFLKSEFNTPVYQELLTSLKNAQLDYSFTYPAFPHKNEFDAIEFVKRNLVTSSTPEEFRSRAIGVLPIPDINLIIKILETFTPVYDKIIFETAQPVIERQVKDIQHVLVERKINLYFEQAKRFYQSSWDSSIPFQIALYPLPQQGGFGATAYNDVAECAAPQSMTDYSAMISVLLHEATHVLFQEQPSNIQFKLHEWLDQSSSRYSRFATALQDEVFATSIANGYFSEKLEGRLNPGNWYNQKYISSMAKTVFPVLKEYLQTDKAMDKAFVNHYISRFEDSAHQWTHEMPFLMTYRSVISDNKADFDTLRRLFPYATDVNYYPDFSPESFAKLRKKLVKCVVVSNDHAKKISQIKELFSELRNWQPDTKTDFICTRLLDDKSVIVVINLVTRTLAEQVRMQVVDIE
jgi:hypothetical protein